MPSIAIDSIVNFLGTIVLLTGLFLILTGLGVVKVEKITVLPGRLTLGVGVVLSIIGILLLWSDIQSAFKEVTLTPTTTISVSSITKPAVCGTLKLEAIRPSVILENEMREYKLIGAGFCNDTSISIGTLAFVGNNPKNAPNGLPITVSNDGTWLTVYINTASSPGQNGVNVNVMNPDGRTATLFVGYQR